MEKSLRRYLFRFGLEDYDWELYGAIPNPVGVTAINHEDGLNIISKWVFKSDVWPRVIEIWEDFDIGLTEQVVGLVNIGNPATRGVWLPPFNLFYGADDGRNVPFRPDARVCNSSDFEGVVWRA